MRLALVAVPYDAGQRSVRTGLGPARLLESGCANVLREAGHEVRVTVVELPLDVPSDELARVVALQRVLASRVAESHAADELPIVIAGNCNSAVGTLAARPANTAVVWYDAHGDFNTPDTSGSGMLDGMALAMATGRCFRALAATVPGFTPVDERRVAMIGVRDIDPLEEDALSGSHVRRLTGSPLRAELRSFLRELNAPPLYVHIDLDVLDPESARVSRFAVPGGLSTRELCDSLELAVAIAPLFAVAITAYDPEFDRDGRAARAALDILRTIVPKTASAE